MEKEFVNTIVIGFDSIDEEKRKELIETFSKGLEEGWVLSVSEGDIVDDYFGIIENVPEI